MIFTPQLINYKLYTCLFADVYTVCFLLAVHGLHAVHVFLLTLYTVQLIDYKSYTTCLFADVIHYAFHSQLIDYICLFADVLHCAFYSQLIDYKSYTYTYILADVKSRAAVIVDPVVEMVDRDVALVQDLGLDLKYAGTGVDVRSAVCLC